MPITSHTDQSKELTTFTATGQLTLPEILAVVKSFNTDPPAVNILWDFSEAVAVDKFTSEDLQKTASIAKGNLSMRPGGGGKTAFVATADFIFGLVRMYTAYLELEEIAHKVRVFRTMDEAHQWLHEDQPTDPTQ
jgi:hypothetical protein